MSPEVLREWIQSELPGIKLPSQETLMLLTENSTTDELWNFLTTRVLYKNAEAARAGILLLGDGFVGREEWYDSELRGLKDEIGVLEKEIAELRIVEEEHVPVDDVIDAALATVDGLAVRLIEEIDARYEADASEILQLGGVNDVTPDLLEEIDDLCGGVGEKDFLDSLQELLNDAAKRVIPVDNSERDVQHLIEGLVNDAVLTAFKEMNDIRTERARGLRRLTHLVEGVEDGTARLLAAQVCGEKAVLMYGKTRQGARRREGGEVVDVGGVERACERVCEGNLRMLSQIRGVYQGFDGVLKSGLVGCVGSVGRVLTRLEAGQGACDGGEEIDTPANAPFAARGAGVCVCGFRKDEIARIDGTMGTVERGLVRRLRVWDETRVRVGERDDGDVLRDFIARFRECREIDALRVRNELEAFITQPGRYAVPWLVKA